FYNIFYVGTPGETANLTIDVPYPFVTQGAMPVHVYANVSFDGDCFVPADQIAVFAAQLDNDPDYDLAVTIPDTGLVYVRMHLDYGLKKDVGYTRDGSNNAEKPIGTDVIVDLDNYVFVVGGGMDDAVTIQNENAFKKNPGFGGMVVDGSDQPIEGASVTITGPGVNATVSTDEDGFYFFYYKHKGKEATFTVECSGQFETVAMKANKFVEVNLTVP
ncbi:MAG TPA: carboxypeptidase-like regulatory domain-containing protein, partial [Sedimentisphaerales bacterium]|nr:carboxypeptidase-like regulatory domain-containing protein [Sedimentisphaerales bacterium]